jgi:hypothetical protein
MSFAVCPVFDGELDISYSQFSGENLALDLEALEQTAQQKKLTSLMEFGDNREIPADFAGDPDELGALLGPFDQWFDAAKGSQAIQTLATEIASDPAASDRLDSPCDTLAELQALAEILEAAHRAGRRFRLQLL